MKPYLKTVNSALVENSIYTTGFGLTSRGGTLEVINSSVESIRFTGGKSAVLDGVSINYQLNISGMTSGGEQHLNSVDTTGDVNLVAPGTLTIEKCKFGGVSTLSSFFNKPNVLDLFKKDHNGGNTITMELMIISILLLYPTMLVVLVLLHIIDVSKEENSEIVKSRRGKRKKRSPNRGPPIPHPLAGPC